VYLYKISFSQKVWNIGEKKIPPMGYAEIHQHSLVLDYLEATLAHFRSCFFLNFILAIEQGPGEYFNKI
jgi:hypothetical protein